MRITDIIEAAMPFGKTSNTAGLTFGFEAEMVCSRYCYVNEDVNLYDINEDDIFDEFGAGRDAEDEFENWKQDGHADGTIHEWIDDIGEATWWELVGAEGSHQYGLYGGHIVEYVSWSTAADYLAEDMREEFGYNITTANHSEHFPDKGNYLNWFIESDLSVAGADASDHAMEIVSPVFDNYDEFKAALSGFLEWIVSHFGGLIYTNSSTGLHINIGMKDAASKIDPLKLLLFSGEGWMTKQWRGGGNSHTDSLLAAREMKLALDGTPLTIADSSKAVKDMLKSLNEKSFAINLLTLTERGYVEFRPLGNTDYEKKIPDIFKHIDRFIQLIYISADPQKYRQEYIKKIALLRGSPRQPHLTVEAKLVSSWMETINFHQREKDRIISGGKVIITADDFFYILILCAANDKEVPDQVIKILAKAAGITGREDMVWKALAYEKHMPWGIKMETFDQVRERLYSMMS